MNWDAIGALGQVFGSIAVFITLVYLSIQTNHARKEAHRTVLQNRADALRELQLHGASHPGLIASLVKVQTALGAGTPPFVSELMQRSGISEEEAYPLFFMQLAWLQYRSHIIQHIEELSDSERESFNSTMRALYGQPGIWQRFYSTFKGGLDTKVTSYLDEVLGGGARKEGAG
jgi:hypothetical protein